MYILTNIDSAIMGALVSTTKLQLVQNANSIWLEVKTMDNANELQVLHWEKGNKTYAINSSLGVGPSNRTSIPTLWQLEYNTSNPLLQVLALYDAIEHQVLYWKVRKSTRYLFTTCIGVDICNRTLIPPFRK